MEVLKTIISKYGYITEENLDALEELLGSDLQIVVKTVWRNRAIATIEQLRYDKHLNNWIESQDGIWEVYFNSNQLKNLKECMENNSGIEDIKQSLRIENNLI